MKTEKCKKCKYGIEGKCTHSKGPRLYSANCIRFCFKDAGMGWTLVTDEEKKRSHYESLGDLFLALKDLETEISKQECKGQILGYAMRDDGKQRIPEARSQVTVGVLMGMIAWQILGIKRDE